MVDYSGHRYHVYHLDLDFRHPLHVWARVSVAALYIFIYLGLVFSNTFTAI